MSRNESAAPAVAMTAPRSIAFLDRFMHEEKLLGPNEQAALAFAIAKLSVLTESAAPVSVTVSQIPPGSANWYVEVIDGVSFTYHVARRVAEAITRLTARVQELEASTTQIEKENREGWKQAAHWRSEAGALRADAARDSGIVQFLRCGGWEVLQDPKYWSAELGFFGSIAAARADVAANAARAKGGPS